MSNLPSGADLDAHQADETARAATAGPRVVKSGDVLRYGRSEWAYHGIAIVSEKGDAWDTYTGPNRGNIFRSALSPTQIEAAEFLGNLDEFTTATPYPFCWDDYGDEDTIFIPVGSYREMRYVRKDAKPSSEKCLYRVDSKLQSAKWSVESAQRDIELVEDALRKLGLDLKREARNQ